MFSWVRAMRRVKVVGGNVTVYAGPTLNRDDVAEFDREHHTTTVLRSPIKHGDLFGSALGPDETVVVIDGLYHQNPALRHKEYLHALHAGARVIGASSIGAIRGAELSRFGMEVVGTVGQWYVHGEIDSDAEVAVAHLDDEHGWRPLSIPMVNIRYAAQRCGFDSAVVDRIIAIAREIFYAERSGSALVNAIEAQLGSAVASALLPDKKMRREHDVKKLDALTALRRAHFSDTASDGRRSQLATADWRTPYFYQWQNDTIDSGRLVARVEYQQLYCAEFPAIWLRYLEYISEHPYDSSPGRSMSDRFRSMASSAAPDRLPQVFLPRYALADAQTVAILLSAESAADVTRVRMAKHAESERNIPGSRQLKADVADELLRELWGSGLALEDECRRRGFAGVKYARRALRRFIFSHHDIIRGTTDAHTDRRP
ncbi:TfuA-like protein [Nocardia cyriacigeorgica]|uniref:TfuA-like protein n=1 Tax=Nocardia cyriacigeorgica TaxID=135487 RepID=UPI00273FBB4C|nr:TfuA-like protein [Nocardia cyriacigeorgica]